MNAPYSDLLSEIVAEHLVQVGEVLGFVNLKAIWLAYVRPDISPAESAERYRKEMAASLDRLLQRLLLPDDKTHTADENECLRDRLRKADRFYAAGLVGDNDPFMDTIREFDVRSMITAYAAASAKDTRPEALRALADRRVYPSFTDLVLQIERFGQSAAANASSDDQQAQALVAMANVIQRMREQLIPLSQSDIATLRMLSNELMLFLQAEPDAIKRMHWRAFQELVWEKFACDGFHVQDVSTIKNSGGDLIAVQQEGGKQVRHLVECKRHKDKIGMDVFNQVVGAADNCESEHVFLVTSSDFTSDVVAAATDRQVLAQQPDRTAKFKNVVVDLIDGQRLIQWLRQYKVREDGGLWLRENWDLEQKEAEVQPEDSGDSR